MAVFGSGRYNRGNEVLLAMDEHTTTRAPLAKGPAWKAAEAYGFDMSLIECSLELTPAERIRQHSQALKTAMMLRASVKKHYGRSCCPADAAH